MELLLERHPHGSPVDGSGRKSEETITSLWSATSFLEVLRLVLHSCGREGWRRGMHGDLQRG